MTETLQMLWKLTEKKLIEGVGGKMEPGMNAQVPPQTYSGH
jgi:hypothetical protein